MSRAAEYRFIPTDPEDIIIWLTSQYEEIMGVTVQPASPESLFIHWMAEILVLERVLSNYAGNQNIPSRAIGANLDALAELFYTRKRPGATAATCAMRFTISQPRPSATLLPKGTRVTDISQTLVWETTEDVFIQAGERSADVKAVCQTVGRAGNGYVAGQINALIDPFAYVISCENITESDGGADEATDEEFYELLRLSMDGYSTAGPRGGYVYFARQVSTEITDVIAATPAPGVVRLYVLMDDGEPAGEEIKTKVREVCSADDVRPLTDLVTVDDPERVDYRIRLTYYIPRDTPASAETLERAVQEKVREYVRWQCARLGRDINPSRLISLLMETGIKRVELEEPMFQKLEDGRTMPFSVQAGEGIVQPPELARLAGTPEIINGGYEDE